jgi:hypothetical protein
VAERSGSSEPLTGGCLCGAIRFELSRPPRDAGYCHCTRCQRRTGTAASAQARVQPGSVRLLAGSGHLRGWSPPGGAEKCFCEICGAHLFARDPVSKEIRAVRFSAFDRDPGVRPSFRPFVAYAASWEPIPDDGLERFGERRPPAGS